MVSAKYKLDIWTRHWTKREKTTGIGNLVTKETEVTEGVEEQSELILAAKDMMDKVTSFLEDLASMKTEGMH